MTAEKSESGKVITILGGAGLMGAGIVRDLISDYALGEWREIRVCDRAQAPLDALLGELDDARLSAHVVDVTNRAQMIDALADADLCINAVPTLAGHQMAIFEICLDERCHYLDLGGLGVYTVKQLEWRERFRDAGVVAVISTGADPGLSNMLCRAVADEFDTIERIHLYWAAELVGPENPVLVPPYSISTVLAEYARPSTQFLNGQHTECAPMTGRETLELPEPWGRTEFMYSPHSEPLTVPLAEGIAEKGIRDFTWKLHLPQREHEAWVGLVKAGFGDFDTPIDVQGVSVKPLDFLQALIERNMAAQADAIPQQDSHELHFAIGVGTTDGQRHRVRWQVAVHPHPLYQDYVDAGTSMNASLSAQLILTTTLKPGVWAPEEYFEPVRYFEEVQRRHMQVSSSREAL